VYEYVPSSSYSDGVSVPKVAVPNSGERGGPLDVELIVDREQAEAGADARRGRQQKDQRRVLPSDHATATVREISHWCLIPDFDIPLPHLPLGIVCTHDA
jgi:hypothetical protein